MKFMMKHVNAFRQGALGYMMDSRKPDSLEARLFIGYLSRLNKQIAKDLKLPESWDFTNVSPDIELTLQATALYLLAVSYFLTHDASEEGSSDEQLSRTVDVMQNRWL